MGGPDLESRRFRTSGASRDSQGIFRRPLPVLVVSFLGLAAGEVLAQSLGMVVDDATRKAVVFDTSDDTVVGTVTLGPPRGPGPALDAAGDCALFSEHGTGFVTDFRSRLWAIDVNAAPPRLATPPNPIPISNPGEDVAFTPDGRYLITCDGNLEAPISVVDTALRAEVSTFDLGPNCNAVEVCDDGSVLVSSGFSAVYVDAGVIRRLTIDADGTLHDTGEFLAIRGPFNLSCAPGSRSGVVLDYSSGVQSFSLPGLAPVSLRGIDRREGISTAISPTGDRLYVRSNNAVDVFSLDPATGVLGTAPLLTIPLPAGTDIFYGMDQMTLDRLGRKLYVPQPTGVLVLDAMTGAPLRVITHPAIVNPTGVCVAAVADRDRDGLPDPEEQAAGTDPDDPDSDEDGLLDGFEVASGFNPLAGGEAAQDPDGDGLDNLSEQTARTDAGDPDTDGDGLSDGEEVLVLGTNPLRDDTDRDGAGDATDNCPLTANPEQSDAVHPGGGGDACDDPDGDGVFDGADNCPDLANADQANADGDWLGDACDPFPALFLRVRLLAPLAATTGPQPVPIRYRLEDAEGNLHTALTGIRTTLTLSGSALFGSAATEGLLISGGGTNHALVEFVGGLVALTVTDAVDEVVTLGFEDSEAMGIAARARDVRFRATVTAADPLAMVVDDATRRSVLLDTVTDTIVASVPFPDDGPAAGDCALPAELGVGFLTDFGDRLWAIDAATAPPRLADPPNPIPIANPGEDLALTRDGRYMVACDGSASAPVVVVDTLRQVQVSSFGLGSDCTSVDVCEDGSVLVSSTGAGRIRRLTLDDDGGLRDTGEVLSLLGVSNIYCSAGATSGVAVLGFYRALVSFTIPGLTPVIAREFSGTGHVISAALPAAGERLYARGNNAVDVFSFDPRTGVIGWPPLLTIPLPNRATPFFGMEQMALHRDGGRLYVPQPDGVRVHDALTGDLVATVTDAGIVAPTGVCIAQRTDADGDGLDDREEAIAGTDFLERDTDGDGLRDGYEVEEGFDPRAPGEGALDEDGDGLSTVAEQNAGTDPSHPDTDGDGLPDGTEVQVLGTHPRHPDTDADGAEDAADNCPLTFNPAQEDVVHPNGIGDACDDPDADGVFDTTDSCPDAANADQADGDGDLIADACDPFPTLALRVRPLTLLSARVGAPGAPVRYRLEDATGAFQGGLGGVRVGLTVNGSAIFGPTASQGAILAGGGTNSVVVEFEKGLAVLWIIDTTPDLVTLGGTDSQRVGVAVLPAAIRFRSDAVAGDDLAMVVDDTMHRAIVLDTTTDTILGSASFPERGPAGDCALPSGLGDGFLTNTASGAWVVEVSSSPPQVPEAPPIFLAGPAVDIDPTGDSRYLVACHETIMRDVSVVDTVRRVRVATFSLGATCNAVDVCDDGSVLVSLPTSGRVRRLVMTAAGGLIDTGESLPVSTPVDVVCAPGSRTGLVVGADRTLQSFAVPGLVPLSQRSLAGTGAGISAVINRAGSRIHVRANNAVTTFGLDAATGALDPAPLHAFSLPVAAPTNLPGADQIALDRGGGKLYVPLASLGVQVHDAATGAFVRSIVSPYLVSPTGVCTMTLADADDDRLADGTEATVGSNPENPDSDGDGLLDGFEFHHGLDPLNPGDESRDPDGDGLDNLSEQSLGTGPLDPDSDDDGLSDGAEALVVGSDPRRPDTDGDLDLDGSDNCPLTPNSGQEDEVHPNGIGDACEDPDGDGVFDLAENCPDAANVNQADVDADGRGDVCDPCPLDPLDDPEGDGVCGDVDLCAEVADPGQEDEDLDRVGDACDICPAVSNPRQGEREACIAVTANGGQCLETTIELVPGVIDGHLLIPANATDIPFTGRVLPALVDVSALPNGAHEICIDPGSNPTRPGLLASTNTGLLLAIDTSSGAGTLLGNLPSPAADIESDPVSGRAFLVTNRELREFDIATGAAIGAIRGTSVIVASLEFVGETLYGSTSAIPNGAGDLRRIHPDTGVTALVGATGTPVLSGLAWHEMDGVLYGVTGGTGLANLVTVNLATGGTTLVGPTGRQLGSLQFGPDGALYAGGIGGSTGRVFHISRTTGAATLIGLSGFGDLTGLTNVEGSGDCVPFTKSGEDVLAINGAACGAPTALAETTPSVECTSPLGAPVTLDGSGSTDPNSTPGTQDDIVLYEWLANPGEPDEALLGTGPSLTLTLPLASHDLALRVTDSFGATDTDAFVVAVVDSVAPAVSLGVTPMVLWPPNHRMVKVDATPGASDLCSTPTLTLHSIASSEPDDADGPGDGDTSDDIRNATLGTLDAAFDLRAERDGTGPGRFYTVTYRAIDAAGNASLAEALVTVPHAPP